MPSVTLSPLAVQSFRDNNGNPLAGGQLFTYKAGSSTKTATYTDSTGSVTNTNPVILNARGEAPVWIPPNTGFKFVLASATDTDPPSAPIWTVDNITNSQLITLYGGQDTGITNAYVLNFTANFASLTNGIVIYWIPTNTNTGPSTINVNGLGVQNISNQDGTVLGSGQIVAGGVTCIFYYNGQWLLTSSTGSINKTGSFVATLTSGPNTQSITCQYSITGYVATVYIPVCSVTNSGGALSLTGWPVNLQPNTSIQTPLIPITNNQFVYQSGIAYLTPSNSTVTLYPSTGSIGATWSGTTIGLGAVLGGLHIGYPQTITYGLF